MILTDKRILEEMKKEPSKLFLMIAKIWEAIVMMCIWVVLWQNM